MNVAQPIALAVQDFAEIARINALPQGSKPVQTTRINENGKSVTITTDQNGKVTVTKSTDHLIVPVVPPSPQQPLVTIDPDFLQGTIAPSRGGPRGDQIPQQAMELAWGFFGMCLLMVIGWPIARAVGRRIERRGELAVRDPGATDQLRRIEQAVDAMAIEVERISESQRFIAKVHSGSTAERV